LPRHLDPHLLGRSLERRRPVAGVLGGLDPCSVKWMVVMKVAIATFSPGEMADTGVFYPS
jgi:hypothetical protein